MTGKHARLGRVARSLPTQPPGNPHTRLAALLDRQASDWQRRLADGCPIPPPEHRSLADRLALAPATGEDTAVILVETLAHLR